MSNIDDNRDSKASRKPRLRPNFGNLTIQDHHTLEHPSSSVIFDKNDTHVFSTGNTQIILERQGSTNNVKVKQFDEGSPGLFFLRFLYTLMAVLVGGFLFVFCIQLVLFLFLGLAIESGLTSQQDSNFLLFFGTLCAIPAFLYGMSNAMTIIMVFIGDTWNGQKFMKTIIRWDSVLVDWINIGIFLFVPLLIGTIFLSTGSEFWWEYTTLAWFISVFVYYLVFAAVCIFHEIDGCLGLVRFHPTLRSEYDESLSKFNIPIILKSILLRQRAVFGGYTIAKYIAHGSDASRKSLDLNEAQGHKNAKLSTGILSRMTIFLTKFGLYKECEQRQYTIDEVQDFAPFVTNSSWGLEKLYCRNRQSRFVPIIEGKSAMTARQVQSSFFCFLIGFGITFFLLVSALFWFDLSPIVIGVFSGLYCLAVFTRLRTSLNLKKVYEKLVEEENEDKNRAETLFDVVETYRITEPTDFHCWIRFGLEILVFFFFPIISLFVIGNYPVALTFICVATITGCRRFLNSGICFQQLGSLEGLELNNSDVEEDWREKHRLGRIVSDISRGRRRDFWISVFVFFILIFCAIFVSAVALGTDAGDPIGIDMSSDLSYEGSDNFKYASCQLGRGFVTPSGVESSLVDFTFLSTMAYVSPNATQLSLDTWFMNENVQDHETIVEQFKSQDEEEFGASSVSYKYIGFPNQNAGVVSIRGTSNSWDVLTDAQLWSSAYLAQLIRSALPFGQVFTPILKYLVKAVSLIESESLENVAFYKQTTRFVQFLRDEDMTYDNIVVTGHSLGGGLAMITGAQNEIPAVALSGPNALLSRWTFNPIISKEALEKYTFNIVPDRDIVPMIDDLSQNYQRIDCRADPNNPIECHFGARSLCEILYTCGSMGRPIPCLCVKEYGYPEPDVLIDGLSFDSICL